MHASSSSELSGPALPWPRFEMIPTIGLKICCRVTFSSDGIFLSTTLPQANGNGEAIRSNRERKARQQGAPAEGLGVGSLRGSVEGMDHQLDETVERDFGLRCLVAECLRDPADRQRHKSVQRRLDYTARSLKRCNRGAAFERQARTWR